jgi:hypothetical protein
MSDGNGNGNNDDSPKVIISIREAILHSADLLKTKVTVEGTVRVLDRDLGRMDMARDGAKLIVRLAANGIVDGIVVGDEVAVTGILRKEQRQRAATDVSPSNTGSKEMRLGTYCCT